MRWPLLLVLGACINFDIPVERPALRPAGVDETECHLAPAYDGKLKWDALTSRTQLWCTAKNASGPARPVCFTPYVGVKETGAIYTSHDTICTEDNIQSAEAMMLPVTLDMRRELCRMDRGGCIVRAIALQKDRPDATEIVAFARGLEAQATMPGRDRPTVGECTTLVDSWRERTGFAPFNADLVHPDGLVAICIGLSRAELACLQAAPDARTAEACAPRMP
jgi:hypothetical protein